MLRCYPINKHQGTPKSSDEVHSGKDNKTSEVVSGSEFGQYIPNKSVSYIANHLNIASPGQQYQILKNIEPVVGNKCCDLKQKKRHR